MRLMLRAGNITIAAVATGAINCLAVRRWRTWRPSTTRSWRITMALVAFAATLLGLLVAPPAMAQTTQTLGVFQVVNRQTGECLTIGDLDPGPLFFEGENVRIWTCRGSNSQIWKIDLVTNRSVDAWILSPRSDPKKCLDVQWASPDNGADIWLWRCNGTNAQRFHQNVVEPAPGNSPWMELRNLDNFRCVDKASWDVVQWECDPYQAKWWQQWILVRVE